MPLNSRFEKLGQKIVKNLEIRRFEAFYVGTKEEALKKALELTPKNDIVSWGGSASIQEIGLLDILRKEYKVIDRDTAKDNDEKIELMRKSFFADTYFASVNAMNENGEFVNIDGTGNRVASIVFGPKSVILIIGMNKIVKSLDDAISRARNVAAPINAQRFPFDTPCHKSGSCENCISKDCICSHILITRVCRPQNRIKIILVGENLGY